jgi:hypothetical protein
LNSLAQKKDENHSKYIILNQFAFDHPIEQDVLNIENKNRTNLFSWRGQFSPQLIEALMGAYASDLGFVLDPFVGSGTTLYEAARFGLPAVGLEINPAAAILARVYELCNLKITSRRNILTSCQSIISRFFPITLTDEEPQSETDAKEDLDGIYREVCEGSNKRAQQLIEAFIIKKRGLQ